MSDLAYILNKILNGIKPFYKFNWETSFNKVFSCSEWDFVCSILPFTGEHDFTELQNFD